MGRLAGCLVVGILVACGAPPAVTPPTRPPAIDADGITLEARALLLLMADERRYDPFSIETVRADHPALWPDLAITLGRIGDERGLAVLEGLLLDGRPEVRRRAAFALGRIGDRAATPALLLAVADRDRETGRRSVEALARLGLPLVRIVEAALPLAPEERWPRLCPELFRFQPEEVTVLAGEALAAATPEDRAWAIHALTRKPTAEGRELLRMGLLLPDPRAQAWAARGLGVVGEASDLGRLRPLLDSAEIGPVVQALRAAASLIDAGRVAAPSEWVPRLEALLEDRRAGVRLTALEAASQWLLEPRLGAALARLAAAGKSRERQVALLALTAGGDPRAPELIDQAAGSVDPGLRAVAATAAARLEGRDRLDRFANDKSPRVRAAVLAARLEDGGRNAANAARRALLDPDPAVRSAALGWLEENPASALEEIALALHGEGGPRPVQLRLDAVAAFAARAAAEPLERGAIVATLESLATDEEYLVRRAAAEALAELGRPRPEPEPVATGRTLADYRAVARVSGDGRRVELKTERGTVTLELDCPAAPLTCHGFLQLANQGFYDGLVFHRVVPDFVVQAGDPRGDGWGGPGFTLRDEPNLQRFERGVIGMARSAPDTAGSQFFITLAPQPHLDGDYTAFGRVVRGMEVLDGLVQGDRIVRLAELGRADREPTAR